MPKLVLSYLILQILIKLIKMFMSLNYYDIFNECNILKQKAEFQS